MLKKLRGTLKLTFKGTKTLHYNTKIPKIIFPPPPQQTSAKFLRASETCKIYLFCKFWIWGKNIILQREGGQKYISLTTNIHPWFYYWKVLEFEIVRNIDIIH